MANGDVVGVTVLAIGWKAEIEFESDGTMDVGGVYDMDAGSAVSSNDGMPVLSEWATAKAKLAVVSEGYSDALSLTTYARTAYVTRAVMKAYPNQAQAEERLNGTNVVVTVALHDPVHDDDKNGGAGTSGTDPTATLLAGFYTENSVASAAATAMAVTNSSTLDYPKAFGRFATLPYDNVLGAFDIEALCVQMYGREGRAVRAVKFSVSDGTTTITSTLLQMEPSAYDGTWLYVGHFNASSFADVSVLTCDVIAYPWVGDAASVFDTTGVAMPSLSPTNLKLLCKYQVTYACVDWTSQIAGTFAAGTFTDRETVTQAVTGATATVVGAQSAGASLKVCEVVGAPNTTDTWTGGTSGATFTPSATPVANGVDASGVSSATQATAEATPYKSTRAAINGLKSFNNTTYGRNTSDAGIVVIKAGDGCNGSDAVATAGTTTNGAVVLQPALGVTKAQVRFVRQGSTSNTNGMNHKIYRRITVKSSTAAVIVMRGNLYMLWDDCTFEGHSRSAANSMLRVATHYWFRGCAISLQPQGYGLHGGASPNHAVLVRNCTGTDLNDAFLREVLCAINVTFTDVATGTAPDFVKFVTERDDTLLYCATGIKCRGSFWPLSGNISRRFIGNVVWEYTGNSTAKAFSASNDFNVVDYIVWHVTAAGQRFNVENDDAPDNTMTGFSSRYSAHYYTACKHDVFGLDGTLSGWWWSHYGVGCLGIVSIKSTFPPNYGGLGFLDAQAINSVWVNAQFDSGDTPDANGTGGGDYHPVMGGPLAAQIPAGLAVLPAYRDGVAIPNDGSGYAGALGPYGIRRSRGSPLSEQSQVLAMAQQ